MKNYTITVNGNVYEVSVEEGNVGVASAPVAAPVAAPKAVAPAQAVTPAPVVAPAAPKEAPKAPAAASATGSIKVNAPMPGKIIAVKANVGEVVKRGDVVIILEAMKMENEIVAPSDGTVASVNVAVGANVESGEVLATLN